jgi:hypothetical protein
MPVLRNPAGGTEATGGFLGNRGLVGFAIGLPYGRRGAAKQPVGIAVPGPMATGN